MKKPFIEISFSQQKKLQVYFDRNDKREFPNKTIAKAYSFKLKRLIKETIIMLSNFQSEIYKSYRSFYLYLPNSTSIKLLNHIRNFDFKIDFVFKTYSKGNGAFLFHSIQYLFNTLNACLMLLKDYAMRYKAFSLKNEVEAIFNQLDLLEKDFSKKKMDLDMCFSAKRKIKVINIQKVI